MTFIPDKIKAEWILFNSSLKQEPIVLFFVDFTLRYADLAKSGEIEVGKILT